jgi:hypothetical protein
MPATDFASLSQLLATSELADLGPGPRAGVRSEAGITRELAALFAKSDLTAQKRELIRALVLLWHDHLDTAHTIAQDIENPDGAYVHGIMHRREPDYGNAAYWFRRVGKHPAFGELARNVSSFLEAKSETELARELMPKGAWDAFAFIDACERAAREPKQQTLLREIQRIEFDVLLGSFAGQCS